jgi:hypothetical protein
MIQIAYADPVVKLVPQRLPSYHDAAAGNQNGRLIDFLYHIQGLIPNLAIVTLLFIAIEMSSNAQQRPKAERPDARAELQAIWQATYVSEPGLAKAIYEIRKA